MKENLLFIENELSSLLDNKRDYEDSLSNLYLPFKGFQNVIIENFPREENKKRAHPIIPSSIHESNFLSVMKINFLLIYTSFLLFLSMWISFNKVVFLDILIYSFYIAFWLLRRLNQRVLKFFIFFLMVSLIIDMSWMIVFSEVFLYSKSINLLK